MENRPNSDAAEGNRLRFLKSTRDENEQLLEVHTPLVSKSDPSYLNGREWKTGRARFPKFSAFALGGVLLICGALICIIRFSDRQNYDSWCLVRHQFGRGHEAKSTNSSLPRNFEVTITVNIWISILMFVAGKLLAAAFLEALSIHWWVTVMRGKSLKQLHHDYNSGRSIIAIAKNLRLLNWLCFCSVVYTLFGAAGPLLQRSSKIKLENAFDFMETTKHDYITDSPEQQNYKTLLSTSFPSFDQSVFSSGSLPWDLKITSQSFYRSVDLLTNVTNCPPSTSNRPFSQCLAAFRSIGFEVDCLPTTVASRTVVHSNASTLLYKLSLNHNNTFWNIDFDFLWNTIEPDKTSNFCSNISLLARRCTLRPAIVYIPIQFEMYNPDGGQWNFILSDAARLGIYDTSIIAGKPDEGYRHVLARATLGDYSNIPLGHTGELFPNYPTQLDSLDSAVGWFDPVVSRIPRPANAEETMGLLYSLFNRTFPGSLEINRTSNTIEATGGYEHPNNLGFLYDANSPCSWSSDTPPPLTVLMDVRELMFRYSVLLAQVSFHDDSASLLNRPHEIVSSFGMHNESYHDSYRSTRNIYSSNYIYLSAGIALMVAAVACTASLFWGFWEIGREVTLSPLEILRLRQAPGFEGLVPAGNASNVKVDEIIELSGHLKVKYGEVAPSILGIGWDEDVLPPTPGQVYI